MQSQSTFDVERAVPKPSLQSPSTSSWCSSPLDNLWHLVKTERMILALLLVLCLSCYSLIGLTWSSAPAFHLPDTIFKADLLRVIGDLTIPEADHTRSKVHPLFVLLFNPLGTLISKAIGSEILAAIFINAFFGSLNVIFFYLILRGNELAKLHAFLFSVLLGVTASHIVFSSIPDTFVISSASLLFLFLLYSFLGDSRYFLRFFIPASVFSFGITSTNLVLSTIVLFFRPKRSKWSAVILKVGMWLSVIVLLTAILSIIQKQIYPSSTMFLKKFPYGEELNWVSFDLIDKPIKTLSKALPVFFLYNIVAPEILLTSTDYLVGDRVIHKRFMSISRSLRKNMSALRLTIILLYITLVVLALYLSIKNKTFQDKMFFPGVLWLSFVIGFHIFYGRRELFLFSALYTSPYLLTLALSFRGVRGSLSTTTSMALLLLCIGLLVNNGLFVNDISRALSALFFS